MSPNPRAWLPGGDRVWFLLDAVSEMDLGPFYAKYRSDGWRAAAYELLMMVGLLWQGQGGPVAPEQTR